MSLMTVDALVLLLVYPSAWLSAWRYAMQPLLHEVHLFQPPGFRAAGVLYGLLADEPDISNACELISFSSSCISQSIPNLSATSSRHQSSDFPSVHTRARACSQGSTCQKDPPKLAARRKYSFALSLHLATPRPLRYITPRFTMAPEWFRSAARRSIAWDSL